MDKYEQLAQKLNCKPKLNLRWYKNEDLYSEGDIEDIIIDLIANNAPEDYVRAIYDNFSWSTYYHLTHIRKNILNWYPFSEDSDILEIGCGLGAITSVLCEKCRNVTAVELSKRRATAAMLRLREKDNLEIIVGNLNDIQFTKKYDYITLIGVLEYQGSYTNTENPYMDFLKKVKTLLKPDGKLLIAIENQYGLKYWCGAREDHTGMPFEGMNQYTLSEKKVKTFSKETLNKLIKESGFKNTFFYYPMPDYKIPTVIYSQDYLPEDENMHNVRFYYAPNKKTLVAQEKHIYKDIIDNNVFEFFANSFLVECSDSDDIGKVIFSCMSSERMEEYRIGTSFLRGGTVEKFTLSKKNGQAHINSISKNEMQLEQRGLNIWRSENVGGKLVSEFSRLELTDNYLFSLYQNKDTEHIYELTDKLYELILQSSDKVPWQDNIIYSFDLGIEPDEEKFGPILKTGYLDMIFSNSFIVDNELYWFDQEWILENTPAKYVMYRALNEFYNAHDTANNVIPFHVMTGRYGINDILENLILLERLFIGSVLDRMHMEESSMFRDSDKQICVNNVNKIVIPGYPA